MQRIKYSRTMNLPSSNSNSSDDVWWGNYAFFEGKEVVVTLKIDGENTTIYPDGYVHARSLDTAHHPSRSWIKQFASRFAHEISSGWRITGENTMAWHSLFYADLPTYFFVFGIYDQNNFCVSWNQVEEICQLLNLHTAPVIYRGIWDQKHIQSLWPFCPFPAFRTDKESPSFPEDFKSSEHEGYVVRLAEGFRYEDFKECCAKWLSTKFHVTTPTNWLQRPVVPNLLRERHDLHHERDVVQ